MLYKASKSYIVKIYFILNLFPTLFYYTKYFLSPMEETPSG